MRDPVSENRVVAFLPADLLDFLDDEVRQHALTRSAVIRQALALRRSTARRRAATEAEIFAVASGVS